MQLVTPEGLSVAWQVHSFRARELAACVLVKGTFDLHHKGTATAAAESLPVSGDVLDDAGRVAYPSDFAPWKPAADVIVLATAHGPRSRPAPGIRVRMQVGDLVKELAVYGPRSLDTAAGRWSDPGPLTAVRLADAAGAGKDWRLASGEPRRVFDVVQGQVAVEAGEDAPGFGPLSPVHGHRARLARTGTYDRDWQVDRWPWPPEDFDYRYFHAARRDQLVPGYLRGDEAFRFDHLHAQHAAFRGRLPGVRARCAIERMSADRNVPAEHVPLVLDTAVFDLEQDRLFLVWRGYVPVAHPKLADVRSLALWTEPLTADHATPPMATIAARFVEQDVEEPPLVFEPPPPIGDDAEDAEDAALEQEAAAQEAALEALLRDEAPSSVPAPAAADLDPDALARLLELDAPDAPPEARAAIREMGAELAAARADEAAMDAEFAAAFPPPPTAADALASAGEGHSLAGQDLTGMDLSGADLAGVDLRGARLKGARLVGARLAGARLAGANLSAADLTRADLTGADLSEADFTGAVIVDTLLRGANVTEAVFAGQRLAGADLSEIVGSGADFSGCELTRATLVGARLPSADFSQAVLEQADLSRAVLARADFTGARARGASFDGADLTVASLSDGADCTGATFRRARAAGGVFTGATLAHTDFSGAQLTRALFDESDLQHASFERADLRHASFEDARLQEARLTQANLLRATFDRADLRKARLDGANLYEAGFWEASLVETDLTHANVKGTVLA